MAKQGKGFFNVFVQSGVMNTSNNHAIRSVLFKLPGVERDLFAIKSLLIALYAAESAARIETELLE